LELGGGSEKKKKGLILSDIELLSARREYEIDSKSIWFHVLSQHEELDKLEVLGVIRDEIVISRVIKTKGIVSTTGEELISEESLNDLRSLLLSEETRGFIDRNEDKKLEGLYSYHPKWIQDSIKTLPKGVQLHLADDFSLLEKFLDDDVE